MAILVTRPQPDNDATVAALQAKGLEALPAPMLRFEPLPFDLDDADMRYGAVIVTSANALRAAEGKPAMARLKELPLFAVGGRTAEAARDIGFASVVSADGGATALRDLMVSRVRAKTLKKNSTLLYLAGADLARDLSGELGARGFNVVTQTTYRMVPIMSLPREVCDAFAGHGISAVLHYSRRSARAFLDAARSGGVEISALAIPQCCLSESVAAIVRDAGAAQIMVARTPDEKALFEVLDRALNPISR
jgi:uroporphyrinogen-III synthase